MQTNWKKLTCELLSIENKNPTEFWKVIKKMQKWGSNNSPDNIDPGDWLLHFQKSLNDKVHTPSPLLDELGKLEEERFFSEFHTRFTNNKIEKAIKKLIKKASPGSDNISEKLLCAGERELRAVLNLFFNKLFSQAIQPKMFTLNFLITISKKGEIWNLDNYRGISVGSARGKIFALILLNRIP